MIALEFFSINPQENLPIFKEIPKRYQVHYWQLNHEIISPQIVEECEKILSPREKERARAFYFEKDRNSYILANSYLRKILSQYTHIPPAEIHFSHGQYGKPGLKDSPLQFNTSHSHHLIIYGITIEDEIGVDVEYMKPLRDSLLEIVNHQFTAKEQRQFRNSDPQQQQLYFFQTWTKKEAYLKALGTGLYGNLHSIESEMTEVRENLKYGKIGDNDAPLSCFYVEFTPCINYASSVVLKPTTSF